jgi:hypothetical protein
MHTGLFRMYHYGSHKWEDYLLDIQEAQKGVSKKHRREFRDREFRSFAEFRDRRSNPYQNAAPAKHRRGSTEDKLSTKH